ncbi:hypothetical protein VK92_24765 [Burkholderia sp. LK4]|nr:hypothetical protein VL00_32975 [Burkholderia cepacia]KML36330.1 hypothetical protein VL13_28800 [Burkholderia lata]KMN55752.1 hypothetical protein VK92_24765 [Burkholderia sp. LK4]
MNPIHHSHTFIDRLPSILCFMASRKESADVKIVREVEVSGRNTVVLSERDGVEIEALTCSMV